MALCAWRFCMRKPLDQTAKPAQGEKGLLSTSKPVDVQQRIEEAKKVAQAAKEAQATQPTQETRAQALAITPPKGPTFYQDEMLIGTRRTSIPQVRKLRLLIRSKGKPRYSMDVVLGSELVFGKQEGDSDICLEDDSVSRRHCRIFPVDQKLYIEDLNATNPSLLDGRYIKQPLLLKHNALLMIGETEIRISFVDASKADKAIRRKA
jgi:hypothetical protein